MKTRHLLYSCLVGLITVAIGVAVVYSVKAATFKYYSDISITNGSPAAINTRLMFPVNAHALASGAYTKTDMTDTDLYFGSTVSQLTATDVASTTANWMTGIISIAGNSNATYRLYLGDPTYTRNQSLTSLNTDVVSIAHTAAMDVTNTSPGLASLGLYASVYWYSAPTYPATIFEIPGQYSLFVDVGLNRYAFKVYTATANYTAYSLSAPNLNSMDSLRAGVETSLSPQISISLNSNVGTQVMGGDLSPLTTTTNSGTWALNGRLDNLGIGQLVAGGMVWNGVITPNIQYTFSPASITYNTIYDDIGNVTPASITFTSNPASVTVTMGSLTPTQSATTVSSGAGGVSLVATVPYVDATVELEPTEAQWPGWGLFKGIWQMPGGLTENVPVQTPLILVFGILAVLAGVFSGKFFAWSFIAMGIGSGVVVFIAAYIHVWDWTFVYIWIPIIIGCIAIDANSKGQT